MAIPKTRSAAEPDVVLGDSMNNHAAGPLSVGARTLSDTKLHRAATLAINCASMTAPRVRKGQP